jgi:DNA polymerase IV (DinB-like DNA polymerase)
MNGSCNEKTRIILHVDMDHFFSAVEERENPQIKGSPVVVGADPKQGPARGVVKTCNYEARRFGIHSGMPVSKAWRLCPDATYVRGNYRLYKEVSKRIMAILCGYATKFQQWGLDEAFLDVTSNVQDLVEAVKLAEGIKYDILWSERLTCSIGIAPNKLVAKIASDDKKPDGLTVVSETAVQSFLAPLPVQRMLWIGEKTSMRLKELGIRTIGDLASFDVAVLTERFGVMGARFHQYARGLYASEVGGRRGRRKSIGHESTFATDTSDGNRILQRLDDLGQRVQARADKRGLLFKTVTVKIRDHRFNTHTHGKTLPFYTNRLQDLQKAIRTLTRRYVPGDQKIRLVGVRVSNLKSMAGQRTLA